MVEKSDGIENRMKRERENKEKYIVDFRPNFFNIFTRSFEIFYLLSIFNIMSTLKNMHIAYILLVYIFFTVFAFCIN